MRLGLVVADVTFDHTEEVLLGTLISRPEALNSLTLEMLTGIEDGMRAFQDDPDLWVAILTAEGDKAFSSGLDLKEAAPML